MNLLLFVSLSFIRSTTLSALLWKGEGRWAKNKQHVLEGKWIHDAKETFPRQTKYKKGVCQTECIRRNINTKFRYKCQVWNLSL